MGMWGRRIAGAGEDGGTGVCCAFVCVSWVFWWFLVGEHLFVGCSASALSVVVHADGGDG